MATRESIEFDFQQAIAQAEKIEELSVALNTLANNKFQGTLQNIQVNWKGERSVQYLSKGSKLQGKMDGTACDLSQIAEDIRTIAKRIYDSEMAALAIAAKRDY